MMRSVRFYDLDRRSSKKLSSLWWISRILILMMISSISEEDIILFSLHTGGEIYPQMMRRVRPHSTHRGATLIIITMLLLFYTCVRNDAPYRTSPTSGILQTNSVMSQSVRLLWFSYWGCTPNFWLIFWGCTAYISVHFTNKSPKYWGCTCTPCTPHNYITASFCVKNFQFSKWQISLF